MRNFLRFKGNKRQAKGEAVCQGMQILTYVKFSMENEQIDTYKMR